MIITLLGRPLAGKTTISKLVGSVFAGKTVWYRMPVKLDSGEIMDHQAVVTTCEFERQSFSLECIHGAGFMEEAYNLLLPRGDIFIGVFDPQKVIFESQKEFWEIMLPLIKPEKIYFIINKNDMQPVKSPKDFLHSYGVYIDRPTIQISAISQDSIEPLRNFIVSCLKENMTNA